MKMTVTLSSLAQQQSLRTPPAQTQWPVRRRLRQWGLVGVALALFSGVWAQPGFAAERAPHSKPFSRIFVFGDSLSDTGNFYQLSGGIPPAPYFQGRFSNGRVWVEQLADALDMTIACGDNYAVGGATTGFSNYNDGVNGRDYPGLLDQVAAFAGTRTAAETRGALFVVWAGANDFFVALESGQAPAELIGNGVGNTVQAIQQLWQSGARYIVVANVPDLGLTPFALGLNMGPPITQLCAAYNQTLDSALNGLAAAGIPTIRVDAFATLGKMVTHPARFGFTNVTAPLMYVGGNATEFLFWDTVHPTTQGHAVFAEAAADALIHYFSPRHGQGRPAARINCLNGLVNAWDHN